MLRQLTRSSSLWGLIPVAPPIVNICSRFCRIMVERGEPSTAPVTAKQNLTSTISISDSSSDSSDSDSNGSTQQKESTYIEEEVNKFRSMANLWWDPNGDAKPLHSLNALRISLIRDGLIQAGAVHSELVEGPKPLTGLKILDVGCGGGILCEPLARLGASIVGLDAAEENIAVAKLHAEKDSKVNKNVQYICGTVEEHIESLQEKYDAVVASEVLEHIEATDLFVKTCADALKPGGSFFVTTINKTVASWLGGIVVAEYALRLLPPGTHDWKRFIQRQELLFMLEKNGFVTRLVHGMAYNPILNKWLWITPTSINFALHAVKAS